MTRASKWAKLIRSNPEEVTLEIPPKTLAFKFKSKHEHDHDEDSEPTSAAPASSSGPLAPAPTPASDTAPAWAVSMQAAMVSMCASMMNMPQKELLNHRHKRSPPRLLVHPWRTLAHSTTSSAMLMYGSTKWKKPSTSLELPTGRCSNAMKSRNSPIVNFQMPLPVRSSNRRTPTGVTYTKQVNFHEKSLDGLLLPLQRLSAISDPVQPCDLFLKSSELIFLQSSYLISLQLFPATSFSYFSYYFVPLSLIFLITLLCILD